MATFKRSMADLPSAVVSSVWGSGTRVYDLVLRVEEVAVAPLNFACSVAVP